MQAAANSAAGMAAEPADAGACAARHSNNFVGWEYTTHARVSPTTGRMATCATSDLRKANTTSVSWFGTMLK